MKIFLQRKISTPGKAPKFGENLKARKIQAFYGFYDHNAAKI
jgi:hypothetical protein